MRNLIIAAAAVASLVPVIATAQSWGEVRHDDREIRQDRRDLRDARRHGDYRDVRDARRERAEDRADRRGDWREWRCAHPDAYRGPAYAAPRPGWRYRPVAVGTWFEPVYYGRRYWVDPVRYHLPVYGAGRRWIRYGNDVALVNVATGRVLTVHTGFFF